MVYTIVLLMINSRRDHGINSYVFCTNCCKNRITCQYLIFLQQSMQHDHDHVNILWEPKVSRVYIRDHKSVYSRLWLKAPSIAEKNWPQKHTILPLFLSLSVILRGRILGGVQVRPLLKNPAWHKTHLEVGSPSLNHQVHPHHIHRPSSIINCPSTINNGFDGDVGQDRTPMGVHSPVACRAIDESSMDCDGFNFRASINDGFDGDVGQDRTPTGVRSPVACQAIDESSMDCDGFNFCASINDGFDGDVGQNRTPTGVRSPVARWAIDESSMGCDGCLCLNHVASDFTLQARRGETNGMPRQQP